MLIALLRNPADRAYSHYQMGARRGKESRTFEHAIGTGKAPLEDDPGYLSRGLYVDQLLRWTEFFDREQLLVLKSEDLYRSPRETVGGVLDFLGLPSWEPETWDVRSKSGKYEQSMDPVTRQRLEMYFAPHNRRLYDYLGRDLGW